MVAIKEEHYTFRQIIFLMNDEKKLNKISGVTLIELLVGVAVTAIMMGAMFASYTAVNSSYKQVTDKARISSSSRDIVGMMMRDIRLAGYKHYYGVNDEGIPPSDNLTHISGLEEGRGIIDSHDPIIVLRDTLGYFPADFAAAGTDLPIHKKIDPQTLVVTAYQLSMVILIRTIRSNLIKDIKLHILGYK